MPSEIPSSIPPPHSRIPPFPAKEESGCCYVSGLPLEAHDEIVMIAVDGGKGKHPAKLSALYAVLGLTEAADQEKFRRDFIASSMDKKELLWFKLSRHNAVYFQMLLSEFSVH